VTYKNLSNVTLSELRYREIFKWHIPSTPSPSNECVTLLFRSIPHTLERYAYNDLNEYLGQGSSDGFSFSGSVDDGKITYVDAAEGDDEQIFQSLFRNEFGQLILLLPAETLSFNTYYGITSNHERMVEALSSVHAEIAGFSFFPGSIGCNSTLNATTPNFFIGFGDVGGKVRLLHDHRILDCAL